MTHLTPDEMVLHYYGESGLQPDEHLAVCEQCRGEYRALQRVLNAADGYIPPDRDAGFEARLWERLRRELPARAMARPWWGGWKPVAAAAALLIAVFFAGRWSATAPPPEAARDTVLQQAVGYHLDRSRYLLQEAANNPRAGANREEVLDVLGANRLYRQTAEMAGESAIADLLEELEQVLVEMENREESGSEVREMLFKLRIAAEEGKEDRL